MAQHKRVAGLSFRGVSGCTTEYARDEGTRHDGWRDLIEMVMR